MFRQILPREISQLPIIFNQAPEASVGTRPASQNPNSNTLPALRTMYKK